MRALDQIDADMLALQPERSRVEKAYAILVRERRLAMKERNRSIVKDFDAGHTPKKIATDYAMPENTVRTIIWQAGRRVYKTKTPISHLPADQQRLYDKLRRNGHGPGAARQMATLTRGTAEPAGGVGLP